jgi:membrane-associated phospholipid phosphatase
LSEHIPAAPPPVADLKEALPPGFGDRVKAFDLAADRALDVLRGHTGIDRVMYAATELGDMSLLWHMVSVGRGLRSDRDAADAVRIAALLGVESVLVNGVIKSFFKRKRPEWEQQRSYRIRKPRSSSFPSGHASSAFTAAALLSEVDDDLWPLWYGMAVVVATSRAHVRIHHASDVIGGIATGLVLGRVFRRLWPAPVDGNPLSGFRKDPRT